MNRAPVFRALTRPQMFGGVTYSFSPQFGLNSNSIGTLWRFKVSYEIQQLRDLFRRSK